MNIKITDGTTTTYIFDVTKIQIFQIEESTNPNDYHSTDTRMRETCNIFSVATPNGYSIMNPESINEVKRMLSDDTLNFLDIVA